MTQPAKAQPLKALVTGDFGREYLVMLPDRTECVASRKGKKQDVTCGDEVIISMTGPKVARIDEVLSRRNVLFRQESQLSSTSARCARYSMAKRRYLSANPGWASPAP